MRKFFIFLLFLTIFCFYNPKIYASGPGGYKVTGPTLIKKGETVEFDIYLEPGIGLFYMSYEEQEEIEFPYDRLKLEYVSSSSSYDITYDDDDFLLTIPKAAWGPFTKSTTIVTLKFKVLSDAELGYTYLFGTDYYEGGSNLDPIYKNIFQTRIVNKSYTAADDCPACKECPKCEEKECDCTDKNTTCDTLDEEDNNTINPYIISGLVVSVIANIILTIFLIKYRQEKHSY